MMTMLAMAACEISLRPSGSDFCSLIHQHLFGGFSDKKTQKNNNVCSSIHQPGIAGNMIMLESTN
jgi:hypothetical protein